MAFTRVNKGVGSDTADGTSLNLASWNVSSGNLLVAGFSWENNNSTLTITDTGLDTFTLGTKESPGNQWTQGGYDVSSNSQTANVINGGNSPSATFRGGAAVEYSAGGPISFDTQNTGSAFAVSTLSVSVTTTGTNGVIWAKVKVFNGGLTLTGANDATLIEQFGTYYAHFEKFTTSAGTYTMTCNISGGTTDVNMIVLAFSHTGGGGNVLMGQVCT